MNFYLPVFNMRRYSYFMKNRITLSPKIDQFARLRKELEQVQDELLSELNLLNTALGSDQGEAPKVARPRSGNGNGPTSAKSKAAGSKRRRRPSAAANKGQGELTLREAVNQVLGDKPMSKHEILTAVQKIGYRSKSADPMNPLRVFLYRNYPRTKEGLFTGPPKK
jgi:hypothetical protein